LEEAWALADAGDLMGALRSAMSIRDEALQDQVVIELIGGFGKSEMSVLMAELLVEDGENRQVFGDLADSGFSLFLVLDRWAEVDPDGIESFLLSTDGVPKKGSEKNKRALSLMMMAMRDRERAVALLDEIRSTGSGEKWEAYVTRLEGFLAAGIASADPVGALDMLIESGTSFDSMRYLSGLVHSPGVRVEEMFGKAMQVPEGLGRNELLIEIFTAWRETDPEAALAAVDQVTQAEGREAILETVLDGLAATNPQAGGDFLESMAEGSDRDLHARKFVSQWVKVGDPVAALRWAEENLLGSGYMEAVDESTRVLPPEIAQAIISAMDEELRSQILTPDGASSFSEPTPVSPTRFVSFPDSLTRWAESDALGTLEWLREIGGQTPENRGSGRTFGFNAAREDLESAYALVEDLPEGRFRTEFLEQVLLFGGRSDPEQTYQWATQADPSVRDSAKAQVLEGWAREDPQQAIAFAQTQDAATVGAVVDAWAQFDAGEAYRWLLESEQGNPEAMTARLDNSQLMDAWINQDAAGAAEAMAGFPEDLAPERVAGVVDRWAADEPSRASQYINDQLEPGPVRDAAVVALIDHLRESDRTAASRWAESISDVELRGSVLETLPPE